ncbi:hypothetical protein [Streptomyces angustmyceticus]|uniref:hypothetical protein n=1 Tax=Streptomyces angustmyceticus TaxID=285578 RepID=UPI00344BB1D1
MRRTTTVAAACAAVLCLGSLLAGCGSADGEGYVAVGAAGPAGGRAPSRGVPPEGGVELTPLDGAGGRGSGSGDGRSEGHGEGGGARAGSSGAGSATGPGTADEADGAGDPGRPGASGAPRATSAPPAGAHTGHGPGGVTPPASPSAPNSPTHPGGSTPPHGSPAPEPPSPTIPPGPGAPGGLLIGKPALAGTDVRWCQKVTLDFLNNGDRPVTTGSVTFGTHIIGALGIDWATRTSTHALPLPLAAGKKKTGTWRVCVDSWRVPPGMHLDTEDVTFTWK